MRLTDLVGADLAAQVPEVSLPQEVKSGQVIRFFEEIIL